MLRLRLLGGLSVESSGAPVGGSAAQPRRLALLAVIARAGARGITREQLQSLLWPDLDDERARKVIAHALYSLRRDLGAEDAIEGVKELRLQPNVISCDLLEFESALAAGDHERAATSYGGPFLRGFRLPGAPEFDRWADAERTILAQRNLDVLEKLARAARRRGDVEAALHWWRKATALDPLNARFTTELMDALVAAGNVAGALQQAKVYEALIDEELSLPPDREVVMLAERIREEAARARPTVAGEPEPGAALDDVATEPPAPGPTSVASPRRSRRRSYVMAGLAAAMLIAAGIATGIALRNGAAARPSTAEPVLVIGAIQDRRNAGEAGLGAVSDLLATSLARAQGVHVVSTARLYELLAQMRANVEQPSPADIAAAARQAGATELVDGAVYQLADGKLRLDFRRTRIATGELVGSHTLVGADLFALVDSGTIRLARDIGARLSGVSIANVTTSSEIAYRFYEEGLRHYVRNDFPQARELFEAALREDTTFALAAFRAALTTDLSQLKRRFALLERARTLAARATDRERLTIQVGWAFYVGDHSLLPTAETLAVRYPHEVEGHYYKGTTLKVMGRNAEAIPPLQRVVALDSLAFSAQRAQCSACDALAWLSIAYLGMDSSAAALREARRWIRLQPESHRAWATLGSIMLALGRAAEATESYDRAIAIEPGLATDPGFINEVWIRQGRPDSAERQLRALGEAGEPRHRYERNWSLAIALKEQRKMAAALAAAAEARSVRQPPPEDTLRHESLLLQQQVYLESNQPGRAAALMDTLVNRPSSLPPQWQASLKAWALTHRASALFAAGDTAALAAIIEPMAHYGRQTVGRQPVHHYARGLLYSARGDLEAAASALRKGIWTSDGGFSRARYHLAVVLVRLGRPEQAVPVLQRVLIGGSLYTSHAEAHELLGNAWEVLGNADSAAVHYRVLLDSWRDADPEFRARRELVARRLAALVRAPAD